MDLNFDVSKLREMIEENLSKMFGVYMVEASVNQIYKACAVTVNDILRSKRRMYNHSVKKASGKRVYYLSMEFLLGRSLKNNLWNLGLTDLFSEVLASVGTKLEDLYNEEPDAGLGNGGLGRLGACYLDALAACTYPAMGMSLCYEYGLFKQKIINGWQTELPDVWLPGGEVWLTERSDKVFKVRFGGEVARHVVNGQEIYEYKDYDEVEAMAIDMMISGHDTPAVSVLRLWKSANVRNFDITKFSQGAYEEAMRKEYEADLLTKFLYPSDDHAQGKMLRLRQQYFLVSAAVQNIVFDHMRYYSNIKLLPEKVAIHINDTHPALAIPELMRILLDEYHLPWEEAWDIMSRTFTYTNHTIMAEALECWPERYIYSLSPRIAQIIEKINAFFLDMVRSSGIDEATVREISVYDNSHVRMANLCIIGSHTVNGVSALHSRIITESIFRGFYKVFPERFVNVTNGIAYRRWLYQSNPGLGKFLHKLIGPAPLKNVQALEKLLEYKDDPEVLEKLEAIKFKNKRYFTQDYYQRTGFVINPHTRFDVQIKRLHEYKRQLLNVLRIVYLITLLEEDPTRNITPQTFIFGAKAAGSYYVAKQVIELIVNISEDLQKRFQIRDKVNVVFIEDYNVSVAEKLIPASEVSEQISLAGKEASGTSNMKFMINGALTLGTLDGANVEINELVGDENMFIFGMKSEEVNALWDKGYDAHSYYENNPRIKRVIDRLIAGFNGKSFKHIADYLINGYPVSDPYMCLADFDSYLAAYDRLDEIYRDKQQWNRMSLVNIAKAGAFSADRAVTEYAESIWHLQCVK